MKKPRSSRVMTRTVRHFKNAGAMAARTARLFRDGYRQALRERGTFAVVISGGRMPPLLFGELAALKGVDWSKVFFFFADERLARCGSGESNFRAARDLLFSKAPVPAANVFPVPVSKGDRAAGVYEKNIRGFFKPRAPRFDLVLLGLGTDGHTASLFPGGPALGERRKLAVRVTAPAYAAPRRRVTMTLKALNSSGTAVFLVSGRDKKDVFRTLAGAKKDMPASKIRPADNLYLFYSENP